MPNDLKDKILQLRNSPVSDLTKGIAYGDSVTAAEVEDAGWNILNGDLTFPLLLLKAEAVDRNLKAMAEWCRSNDLLLAPHGKTTMAPQLYQRQLDLGAWAITVANVAQANICAEYGIKRIIIANQVAGLGNLRSLAALMSSNPDIEVFCLVDSIAVASQLADAISSVGRPIQVLIEIGRTGWRTGIRNQEVFQHVLDAVKSKSAQLNLRGIEAFEGSASETTDLDEFLEFFTSCSEKLLEQWPGSEKPIASIGGTAFLDRVLSFAKATHGRLQALVRSGCYVTHDHGMYLKKHAQSISRSSDFIPDFQPAFELWAYVQSVPEPGLAFLTFGKRDVSHDIDLPFPLFALRGAMRISLDGCRVTKLNDQHAYMSLPEGFSLEVGDACCFGISHPCTAFDKWRVIPMVDENYNVVDLIHTFF